MLTTQHIPRLRRGVKLARDVARDTAILNAPERIVVLDDIAEAILRRCDGATSIAAMAEALAADHGEETALVQADIIALLSDLHAQGFVE